MIKWKYVKSYQYVKHTINIWEMWAIRQGKEFCSALDSLGLSLMPVHFIILLTLLTLLTNKDKLLTKTSFQWQFWEIYSSPEEGKGGEKGLEKYVRLMAAHSYISYVDNNLPQFQIPKVQDSGRLGKSGPRGHNPSLHSSIGLYYLWDLWHWYLISTRLFFQPVTQSTNAYWYPLCTGLWTSVNTTETLESETDMVVNTPDPLSMVS